MATTEGESRDEAAAQDQLAAPPIVNIIGDRVALGPLRRDLIPLYQRWINDFAVIRTRGRPPRSVTLEEQEREYDRLATSPTQHFFTVYDRATWTPIGDAGLHNIDQRHRAAFFAITIGEPEYRGRGYGTEATRLVLDYAFAALGLHSVQLEVVEYNLAGYHAYRKAGFREVGRWRQARRMGGRWWDSICMDCLASEFTSPVLGRVFIPDDPREGNDRTAKTPRRRQGRQEKYV